MIGLNRHRIFRETAEWNKDAATDDQGVCVRVKCVTRVLRHRYASESVFPTIRAHHVAEALDYSLGDTVVRIALWPLSNEQEVGSKQLEIQIKNKFDNRIWYYRKIRNLNQKVLSKKLGFSIAELSKIETGKKIPSPEIIAKLTKILNASKKELFPTLKNN